MLGNSRTMNVFYRAEGVKGEKEYDSQELNPFLQDDFKGKKIDTKMGKKFTDMSEIRKNIRAMKKHNANKIDHLVDLEYTKCYNNQKNLMKNFKPSQALKEKSEHVRSQSLSSHIEGEKDIQMFNRIYKEVFIDKDKKSRKKVMKMFK